MRQADIDEIMCQMPRDTTPVQAALTSFEVSPDDCRFVSYDPDGVPTGAFGWAPATPAGTLWVGWAFGTHKLRRSIPDISKFITLNQWPYLMRTYRPKRLEVRSLESHDVSHRWLTSLGATRECELKRYGRDGETFVLYSWTDRTIWPAHERWVRKHGAPDARQTPWNKLRVA
jgi:hypothetical protein